MNTRQSLLLVVWLSAAGGASAEVYKSVGADGKVTYTDRPAAGATKDLSIRRSGGFKSMEPLAPAGDAATGGKAVDASKNKPAHLAAQNSSGGARTKISVEMILALEKAMGTVAIVRASNKLCTSAHPAGFARYGGSNDRWESRHVTSIKDVDRMWAALTAEQRAALQISVDGKVAHAIDHMTTAPPAAQFKWCDKAFDDVDDGLMDFANRTSISGPLHDFGGRP
jgi:hypothetical protein